MTGWTFEYIDSRVTLSQFNRLVEYWSKHPPVHLLLATLLAPPEAQKRRPARVIRYDRNTIEELFSAWRAVGGAVAPQGV